MRSTDPGRELRVAFTDLWRPGLGRDSHVSRLLAQRFDLTEETPAPDWVVFGPYGHDFRRYRCRRLFWTSESWPPDFRECDIALSFAPDSDRGRYLPNYKWSLAEVDASPVDDPRAELKAKTGFCALVHSNAEAPERWRLFDELTARRRVDSGGRYRNNIGHRVGDKGVFLRGYRFSIAFENKAQPGYVTEKLVQAYGARSVPIYWGAPDVTEVFNPRAFVHARDFDTTSELVDFVVELDDDRERLAGYLAEPLFRDGQVPTWLEDDAILDWIEPRLRATALPVATTRVGRRRDRFRLARARVRRPLGAIRRLVEYRLRPERAEAQFGRWKARAAASTRARDSTSDSISDRDSES